EDPIDLSDSSDAGNQNSGRHKRRRTDFVDLTMDSDSDDAGEEDLQPMTQEEIEMINALEADAGSAIGSSVHLLLLLQPSPLHPSSLLSQSLLEHILPLHHPSLLEHPSSQLRPLLLVHILLLHQPSLLEHLSPLLQPLLLVHPSSLVPRRFTPAHANPAMPFPFAPMMAVSGAPPPGAHLPGYYGPFVTTTNDAVTVTYRHVPPQHPFMMPPCAHHVYTTMPMISQPAQAIGATPGQIYSSSLSAVSSGGSGSGSAFGDHDTNAITTYTETSGSAQQECNSYSSQQGSEQNISGASNCTDKQDKEAPTTTVNTTVADMEITGTGARAAQLRRSRALATPSLRSTTTTGATARSSTIPALSRGMSDPRSIGSSAPWTPVTPSRARPSMNGRHSSSAIVTTSPLQNSGSVPSLSSPLRSPYSPLVGVSPTYMSLFQRPQSNTTSHNGPYRPENL
ncbi:hypothetical protein GGH14_003082, partial [Coemansia sp. RSA 370]